jgi:hypothetical protein
MPSPPSSESRWADRFTIVGELGRGAASVIYRAYDHVLGREVALKALPELEVDAAFDLRDEVRALAPLAHENLAALHDLHRADGRVLIARELVQGQDIVTALREADDDRLRRAVVQAAKAIEAVHEAATLVGGLRPESLVVEPTGRVVLLDYGLAWRIRRALGGKEDGAPSSVAAPEAILEGHGVAADWWDFGAVLFAVAQERSPSSSTRLGPQTLTSAVVPEGLEPSWLRDALRGLLADDIDQRLRGPELIRCVDDEAEDNGPRRAAVGGDDLAHLAAVHHLTSSYRALRREEHATWLVRGGPRTGKTGILRRAARQLQAEGALVLTARARARADTSYGVMADLLHGTWRALDAEGQAPRWRATAAERRAARHLFPSLAAFDAGQAREATPGDGGGRLSVRLERAVGGVHGLLRGLTGEAPVVLLLDDAHVGDQESGWFLDRLLRRQPALRCLVVMASDDDEAPKAGLLSAMREDAGSRTLGLPSAEGSASDPAEAGAVPGDLSPDERRVLAAAAVASRPVPLSALEAVVALGASTRPAVAALERRGLLRRALARDVLTVEARSPERVVMDAEERRALNKAWAKVIDERPFAPVEARVQHLIDAGPPLLAAEAAVEASKQAMVGLAAARAVDHLEHALRLAPAHPEATAWRRLLADALSEAGRASAAAAHYRELADAEEDAEAASALHRLAARHLVGGGSLAEGAALYRSLVEQAGVELPNDASAAALRAGTRRLWTKLKGQRARSGVVEKAGAKTRERLALLLEAAQAMALSDPAMANYLFAEHASEALAADDAFHAAHALGAQAVEAAVSGRGGAAKRVGRTLRQLDTRLEGGDLPEAAAVAVAWRGAAAYHLGSWSEAAEHCSAFRRKAMALAAQDESFGRRIEVHELEALSRMGRVRELKQRVPAAVDAALGAGDLVAAQRLRLGPAALFRLAEDAPHAARADIDAALAAWPDAEAPVFLDRWLELETLLRAYQEQARSGVQLLDEQWPTLEAGRWLATAHGSAVLHYQRGRALVAAAAEAAAEEARDEARALMARVGADITTLNKNPFALAPAWAAQLEAELHASQGNADEAKAWRHEAQNQFRRFDMALDAAAAQRELEHDWARAFLEEGVVNPRRLASVLCPRAPVLA